MEAEKKERERERIKQKKEITKNKELIYCNTIFLKKVVNK